MSNTTRFAAVTKFPQMRGDFLVICAILLVFAGVTEAATFTVNSTNDTDDANPGDGVAQDSNGDTTLRAAVEEANALAGADIIQFDSGLNGQTIYLDMGALTITDTLTITGPGSTLLTISRHTCGVDDLELVVSASVTASISGLSVSNNITNSYDGAALASHGTTTITNCLFSSNHSGGAGNGGSIAVDSGTLSVSNTTFIDGVAASGGAIYSTGGTTTITECTFNGHSTSNDGAALYNYNGNVTVIRSVFYGNFSTGNGGAISNVGSSSSMLVVNCTFSGNGATTTGGAIYNGYLSGLTIEHSTVAYNYLNSGTGGGIFNYPLGGVTIKNTIVANNYFIVGCCSSDPDVSGAFTSVGGNLISSVGAATGFGSTADQLNVDPLLNSTLANNGGPTKTHALQAMSPAIDAGLNAGAPSTDQRGTGFTRIVNSVVDIGAFEVQ